MKKKFFFHFNKKKLKKTSFLVKKIFIFISIKKMAFFEKIFFHFNKKLKKMAFLVKKFFFHFNKKN
ncbi:MAG: hypothetical protein B6I24_02625 [Bacteroidetes bacterium 4572_128]|nr:MAG: hypothetical protein B6I24_02625 [Bacteroidetes bacterium 4572_128]